MNSLIRFIAILTLIAGIAAPLSASAQFFPKLTSFGGKVLTSEPCISPLGPSLAVTIKPAGVFPISYIWTPLTITNLVGPPIPGGQVIGTADIPFACWTITRGGFLGLVNIFSYSFGLRMFYIGTSAPSPTKEFIGV